MRATILAGALTALMYGTTAGAQDEDAPQPPPISDELQGADDPLNGEDQEPGLPDQEDEEAFGGSGLGDFGPHTSPIPLGSLEAGEPPEAFAEVEVEAVPVSPDPGLLRPQPGLTSEQAALLRDTGIFGAPVAVAPSRLFEPDALQAQVVTPESVGVADFEVGEEQGIGGAGFNVEEEEDPAADLRGVTVLIGGGVEGYSGNLAPEVNPGATAGVSASFRPSTVLGLEVGYSGALNEVDSDFIGPDEGGADLMRNGGHAALTLGLTASPLQPYVLGGVGVNFYNIRNGEAAGFQDDVVGSVPVGLGLRTHLGGFTADARVNYNFLLGQQFAPTGGDDTGGSYTGTLNLGGTF